MTAARALPDHRDPSLKTALVTRMAGRVKLKRLLEEVAKCDIVCANCHRDRTFRARADAARGSSTVASAPALQAGYAGSIPVSRSEIQLRLIEESPKPYAA